MQNPIIFAGNNHTIISTMAKASIIEQNSKSITVKLSKTRWNRLMELEQAYRIAKAVAKAKSQCETSKSMNISEALQFINSL